MEITVAKKLALVMIATVIMNSNFWCATAQDDRGSVVLSKVKRGEQTEDIVYGKDGITICDTKQCGTTTYDAIEKAFPDAFETEQAAKIHYEGLEFNDHVDQLPLSCPNCFLKSDGDKCCPTWRYFTFTTGPLTNVYNQKCYIIQCRGVHQYIERGLCGNGRCRRCEQQYIVRSLLAWCPGICGLKWHYFKVPSYCSCHGYTLGTMTPERAVPEM